MDSVTKLDLSRIIGLGLVNACLHFKNVFLYSEKALTVFQKTSLGLE